MSSDRRGSSWPVLVETNDGLRFTKLRGAGQGIGALVAEIIVAELADALGLSVPARSLVTIEPGVESLDRDGELRSLLDASVGVNLGFTYLDGGRILASTEMTRISPDDSAAIVWLDRLVMNPDRTPRNPNLMWWHDRLWLIDHGAALGFQYAWQAVDEATIGQALKAERHVLADRVPDIAEWDPIFAARLTREIIQGAVGLVPDDFLASLLPPDAGLESIERRRAAYAAFLWKRLKSPRNWAAATVELEPRRRGAPDWLTRRVRS